MTKAKLNRILNGEKVICSNDEFNEICELAMDDEYYDRTHLLVSVDNENNVGTKDALIVYLKEPFEGFVKEF